MKPSAFVFAAACAGCANTAASLPVARPTVLSSAELSVQGSPGSAPVATSPPATTQEHADESKHSSVDLRNAGWASIAVGATGAVLALGSSIVMLHDESLRRAHCDAQRVCDATGAQANSSISNNGAANVALWALGVVGLGVGTYLVLTNPADHSLSVGIASRPSGADLAVAGTF